MKISANLGFLWNDRPMADAIYLAKQHGFDAVECHHPYDQDMRAVTRALSDTELPMIGLNTAPGTQDGDSGMCALPHRIPEARASIDQAIEYARIMGAENIHVMAGIARQNADTERVYIDNLCYASDMAAPHAITILIEPLNRFDKAGYFLQHTFQAENILSKLDQGDVKPGDVKPGGVKPGGVKRDNVKILFDCYHVQRTEGNVWHRYQQIAPLIGHIQIASCPDRMAPDSGELNYSYLLRQFKQHGYNGYIGAEYIATDHATKHLDWLCAYQRI